MSWLDWIAIVGLAIALTFGLTVIAVSGYAAYMTFKEGDKYD